MLKKMKCTLREALFVVPSRSSGACSSDDLTKARVFSELFQLSMKMKGLKKEDLQDEVIKKVGYVH